MHQPWNKLEKKHRKIKFYKMESEKIPSDLNISGYPHFVLVRGGSIHKTVGGEMAEEELNKQLFGGATLGGTRRRSSRFLRRTRKSSR